jgi:hypothetical protein
MIGNPHVERHFKAGGRSGRDGEKRRANKSTCYSLSHIGMLFVKKRVLTLIAKVCCCDILSLVSLAVISDYFNFPEVSL